MAALDAMDLSELKAHLEAVSAAVAAKEKAGIEAAQLATKIAAPYSKLYNRVSIGAILACPGGGASLIGSTVVVGGWVKTGRVADKGALCFLELNDGSGPTNLQCIVKSDVHDIDVVKSTGTCVVLEGVMMAPPEGATGQLVELHATKVLHVGPCDAAKYPIAKKKISLEFLREKIHLRTRTNTIAAIARIRSSLAYATHTFFNQNGFLYVHTPCITQSDCEGAGEMFQVTTMLGQAEKDHMTEPPPPAAADVDALKARVAAAGDAVKEAKAGEDKAAVKPALDAMMKLRAELEEMEKASRKVGGLFRTAEGKIDYTKDFFSEPTFLTVSGQLQVETYACALTSVYTFGPTFRAENSNTTRHLAEFWMIEPEIAFADLKDDMQCAEDYVRFCLRYVLAHCLPDLEFIQKMYDPDCVNRVRTVADTAFGRVTYTEAIEVLKKAVAEGKEFVYPVEWGIDLATEHERFLAEEIYKGPVIVYNYPKDIKAFYMRLNDDNRTCAAMDVLVPKVGELIGGSQREDRIDVMEARMGELGLHPSDYEWYMDLRRYGSVVHSGFGLGFERLILFCTGMENIRDVIPYPRWPANCT
eukprot:CAMPEP_0197613932 /NCGR_PEP_ID=MMETSP1326-20131121/59263_1 /TAXON_ID=1155430 /ORGANISM="Genus nov. species nov., Strain RCC2288" /LENGTH=586 /DNA_ID=CAMNT_0043182801 /DNA_START=57 /DNA_END=1817 /DNA_ORIENTATION=+